MEVKNFEQRTPEQWKAGFLKWRESEKIRLASKERLDNQWNELLKIKGDNYWNNYKKILLIQNRHKVINFEEMINRLTKYLEYGKSI